MFSLIVGQALMGLVRTFERPLERIEAALAIAAGEKRAVYRTAVRLDLYVSREEFEVIATNRDIRGAMNRAEIAKDMGVIPTCGCCGAIQ